MRYHARLRMRTRGHACSRIARCKLLLSPPLLCNVLMSTRDRLTTVMYIPETRSMYANHGLSSIQALLSLRLFNSPFNPQLSFRPYYLLHSTPSCFLSCKLFLLCVPLQPFLIVQYYIGRIIGQKAHVCVCVCVMLITFL